MQGAGKIIALVVVASVALSVLSSVINDVHVVPLFDQGGGGGDGSGAPADEIMHPSLSRVENDMSALTDEQLNTTMFLLLGRTNTPYMRTGVMTDYADGMWTGPDPELAHFLNEAYIPIPANEGVNRTVSVVTVSPSKAITGGVPTFKDTYFVRLRGGIEYAQELGIFSTTGRISDSYSCMFYVPEYDLSVARNATVQNDERYLGVPDGIAQDLSAVADFVTEGKNSSDEKALALRDYLRTGYIYDFKYEPAPAGEDPVLWFLLHGKKGMCSQFNSALTLLARSAGIPARYVTGYVVNPTTEFDTVRLANAHAYTEIKLDGIGWVILDATPLSFTEPFQLPPETSDWKKDLVTSAEPKNETLARIAGWISRPSPENDPYGQYEIPVGGIDLALYRGSELVRVAGTNAMGNFRFQDLEWGNYALVPILTGRYTAIGMDRIELPCHEYSFHVVHFLVEPVPAVPPGEATSTELWNSNLSLEQRTGFELNGTIRDGAGHALEGMGVFILINNASSGELRICGEGTVTGGSFHVQCTVPDGIATGSHMLVARALGNQTYAPSDCSTSAGLYDFGHLVLSAPVRIPQGVPSVFQLQLVEKRSGLPVPNAVIDLSGLAPNPSTGELGNATFSLTYPTYGEREVSAEFAGNQYVSRCNASIRFNVIALQAEILTETLVRGETNLMVGRVYANNIPAGGVNVTLTPLVAGGRTYNNTTNDFGYFFMTVDVPFGGLERGPREISMSLADCAAANWTVRIKDRARLQAVASVGSAGITLSGPSSEPIPAARLEVSTGNDTLFTLTDSSGSTQVNLPQGSDTVRVVFQGNQEYASAYAVVELPPAGFDWSFLPWVVAGACAVGVGAGAVYSRRSRRAQPGPDLPEEIEEISGPFVIEFPQIERGFPAKWGQDQRLDVSVRGEIGKARLFVDDAEVPMIETGNGSGEAMLLLSLGAHEVRVTSDSGVSTRIVQIIDYREEVARLYQEALDALAVTEPGLTRDHTPREVQSIVAGGLPGACLQALEVAVSRFEVAGFSDHRFERAGYADMVVAVEGIKALCGRGRAG